MACLIYYDDQGTPIRFPLGKATLMLGSASDSQIFLEDHSVSRNHASIIFDKNKFWVRDNGSTNGSIVNGQTVQLRQLENGDSLQFGSYKFFFDEFYQSSAQLEETNSQHVKMVNRQSSQRKGQSYRQTVQVQSPAHKTGIRMMLTESVNHLPDGLCKASKVCGFLGFVAFLPAIILGHMATPKSDVDKKNQGIGLAFGYTFFVIWLIIGGIFLNRSEATNQTPGKTTAVVTLEFPQISAPLELLRAPMVWLPPKGIYENILFNKPNAAIESNATIQKEVNEIRSVFLHGLVWTELNSSLFKLQSSQRKLRLIHETYKTNPTFWEYNSTMVPEKKCYYEPFYFADDTPQCFYDYDRSIIPPLPRFASSLFRWCFGVRGITVNLPADYNYSELLSNFRVLLVTRAGDKPTTLNIETIEGNLTRDEQKSYEYKIVPSTLYAVIVYRVTDRMPVVISTYEKYFSLDETKGFEAWVKKNLPEVVANQPASALAISSPFSIKDKNLEPAPKVDPAVKSEPAPKTKVNFIIEPVK